MSASVLDDFIKSQYAQCRSLFRKLERHSDTLYLALAEMETRFQKQERFRTDLKPLKATTWHEYLQSRGVQPAAFRQWKHRKLQSLVKSATPVVVNINVRAAELARELESFQWPQKLSTVDRQRLNPVVTQRLVDALRDAARQLATLAEQFGSNQKVTFSILGQCGGCSDMHKGVAAMAEAHPDWSDEQLADDSGCSVTIVRQALTRHLWKREVTEKPVLDGIKQITFAYPGGKAKLASTLCSQFPPSGSRFVDVFAGRGNLTFRAMQLLNYDSYWLNDIRTSRFFEALLTHGHLIDVPIGSKQDYLTYRDSQNSSPTPESILLEPFLTYSGGGYSTSGAKSPTARGLAGFGNCEGSRETGGVSRIGYRSTLERAHQLLLSREVVITKLDYKEVLASLGESDFCYLDPPYLSAAAGAYSVNDLNHVEMVDLLLHAKFKWALSEYRHPLYLEAFGEPAWTKDCPNSYNKKTGTECLWIADECAAAFAIEEAA
jgi:hypothetical protein